MSREAHVLVLREPQGEIPWGYSPGMAPKNRQVLNPLPVSREQADRAEGFRFSRVFGRSSGRLSLQPKEFQLRIGGYIPLFSLGRCFLSSTPLYDDPPNEEEQGCRTENPNSCPHKLIVLERQVYRPAEMQLHHRPAQVCQANQQKENGNAQPRTAAPSWSSAAETLPQRFSRSTLNAPV